ncbi:MAG TPA: ATP-binding cassette domain-containing protein [bacterium]|nr:ATP-binding cassette domain-containing protein [bacterium]
MSIIKAKKISKSFKKSTLDWKRLCVERKDTVALEDISIDIDEGELVGFLGPNGAGKTTFLKILSGILYPTSGSVEVLGFNPWDKKYDYLRQIALVMGQKNQLWWDLPAIDSFKLLKEVYSVSGRNFKKNLEMMVDTLGMQGIVQRRLRNMSLGERMKCELTASFLHDPKVIFLDEPTIGLDVFSAQAVRNLLQTINREKKTTMILTSHYMGDIEELCKRVVMINHGKKMYDGELSALKKQYAPERKVEVFLHSVKDREKFAKLPFEKSLEDAKGTIRVEKERLAVVVEKVFESFEPENISISDIELEEVITKVFESQTH